MVIKENHEEKITTQVIIVEEKVITRISINKMPLKL